MGEGESLEDREVKNLKMLHVAGERLEAKYWQECCNQRPSARADICSSHVIKHPPLSSSSLGPGNISSSLENTGVCTHTIMYLLPLQDLVISSLVRHCLKKDIESKQRKSLGPGLDTL